MLYGILLTTLIIVCIALAALVLLQRSEGGALGIGGGGPSGFMSARGAGNLLTRATSILGILFFILALALGVVAQLDSRRGSALENLDTSGLTVTPAAPVSPSQAPAGAATSSAPSIADIPLAGAAPATSSAAPAPLPAAPAKAPAARPAASSAAPASAARATSSPAPSAAPASPSASVTPAPAPSTAPANTSSPAQ